VLQRFLDLPMPVVGVANGPATVHSEYLLLADVHIASERATYGDLPHPTFGITGGDGLHVVWEEIAGSVRAKWLLWTREHIDAQTALQWGVVSEVVVHERALDRRIEIARGLAAKPAMYRTLQKQTLNLNLRRRITQDVPSEWRSKASRQPLWRIRTGSIKHDHLGRAGDEDPARPSRYYEPITTPGSRGSARASSVREPMPSLAKTLWR
jgi:enoyl-CoA hydratase/carnithine racemase